MEYAAIALLVVVVAFVLLKKKSGSKRATRKKPQTRKAASNIKKSMATDNSYAAVSIRCGTDSCESAQTLAGQRFLVNEAPTFPLPGCDRSNCSCKYVRHTARRGNDGDRRAPSSLKTNLFEDSGNVERRKAGRRRDSGST